MSTFPTRLFSWRQILVITAAYLGGVIAVQRSLRRVCEDWIAFDCPYYWPVSIFTLRVRLVRDVIVAATVVIGFFLFVRLLEARKFDLKWVLLSGVLLIAGLTFIHGVDFGFYAPIIGDAQSGLLVAHSIDRQEYLYDALAITDPVDFLRRYHE